MTPFQRRGWWLGAVLGWLVLGGVGYWVGDLQWGLLFIPVGLVVGYVGYRWASTQHARRHQL